MSFNPAYKYIEAEQLAAFLKDPQEKAKTAVVDVRDDDFEGGNIVSAINVPSTTFQDEVKKLAENTLKDKERVVLHCHLSQQRGPKAARIYAETVDELFKSKAGSDAADRSTEKKQEIFVLRDGFGGFGPKYKNDPELVEKFDKESWSYR